MENQTETWKHLAAQLRVDSIRCTTEAGSGHPTSSMSGADFMAVLLTSHLKYDWNNPKNPNNDSLIFSKGHACPLLYAAYKAARAITDEELMSLRKLGSRLEGHPTPDIPWVEAATGSLGQGLSVGVGDALSGKFLDKRDFRVWVILGDSEMAEGSVWEGFAAAGHYKLNNMVAIVDVNRLGQRGPTMLEWDTATYAARISSFGWNAIEIDGHNLDEIAKAFEAAEKSELPTAIIARTEKGKGASLTSNQPNWHGKALNKEQAEAAIAEIQKNAGIEGKPEIFVEVQKPADAKPDAPATKAVELPKYTLGEKVAPRKAYGDALKSLGDADEQVVALDAEVSNSTFAEIFGKAHPDRFFEIYIAEQQMVSAAVGLGNRGKKVFCSTFAAFFSRAYDQIRMSAISQANFKLAGSHAGVSIGEDGPSQMALEDLAMMRAVYGSTVLYPSDATSTASLVAQMNDLKGISFIRTTREASPVLYGPDEKFEIGGSKTLREGDAATVIGAGITLHEALAAADKLKEEGIAIRVIDLYSVKPIDVKSLQKAVAETGALIVVEDHWHEGGLGDAVLHALAEAGTPIPVFKHLAVSKMPRSGKALELLADNGISTGDIIAAVKALKK